MHLNRVYFVVVIRCLKGVNGVSKLPPVSSVRADFEASKNFLSLCLDSVRPGVGSDG